MPSEAHRELEANGFAIVPGAVGEAARQRLLSLLRPARLENAVRHRSGVVFACRHLLVHLPELAVELRRCGVNSLASQFIGKEAFPIDAVYFDKQSAANWAVPVHQDRVLPVATRSGDRHKTIRGVAQRRVLHVVYAAEQADNDLQWRSPT